MVITYVFNADVLNDGGVFKNAYSKVPKYRREKTDRMKLKKDKNLSLGAGLVLNYGLRLLGIGESAEIITDTHGKPRLKDGRICFSISHSAEFVICAFSEKNIGADIEKISGINPSLVKKVSTANEYGHIFSSENEAEQRREFFRLWTAKESAMKFLGTGLGASAKNFETDFKYPMSVKSELFSGNVYFKEYDELTGYRVTVCSEADKFEDNMRILQICDLI